MTLPTACALTLVEAFVIVASKRGFILSCGTSAIAVADPFRKKPAEGQARKRMNLPISLTLLRIFFVPLLVVLLLTKGENMDQWAVGVFLAAAGTDLLDGYLARKRGQITTLGILLDPIADKLLISAAFISLVELNLVPAWMVVIIVGREFAVSGLRAIASAEGFAIEASELGKTKMVFQVVAITVIVLERRHPAVHPLGEILLWVVVVFALASALQYFWSFWRKLDVRVKQRRRRPLVVLRASEKQEEEKDVPAH
jgi:CDP-diacylglycerol--glycerol-3-phosphate 3-phosphatidyltransferase